MPFVVYFTESERNNISSVRTPLLQCCSPVVLATTPPELPLSYGLYSTNTAHLQDLNGTK